jgi:hypothetical protein
MPAMNAHVLETLTFDNLTQLKLLWNFEKIDRIPGKLPSEAL